MSRLTSCRAAPVGRVARRPMSTAGRPDGRGAGATTGRRLLLAALLAVAAAGCGRATAPVLPPAGVADGGYVVDEARSELGTPPVDALQTITLEMTTTENGLVVTSDGSECGGLGGRLVRAADEPALQPSGFGKDDIDCGEELDRYLRRYADCFLDISSVTVEPASGSESRTLRLTGGTCDLVFTRR